MTPRLRVLTWHVHGSYLYYLGHCPHDFYLPVKEGRPEGYGGRCGTLPWPENLREVSAEEVRSLPLDCILFQSRKNFEVDQHEILSPAQRRLPRIYLEHDPPRETPTDTRHVVDDPETLLCHVTHFNDLMWDSGSTPTRVIEHGVVVPPAGRDREGLARGITVVNGLRKRGRRLGLDVFERVRQEVPIDLIGMQSEEVGGLGEVPHGQLPSFLSQYRFFFNPIRYTSLGLAVCEAMMLGLPVIGLATTEMVTAVENGVSGYVSTNVQSLITIMKRLLGDPNEARKLGEGARCRAVERFGIERFIRDWDEALRFVCGGTLRNGVSLARQ
ncbi:MAG: glycosyltransferase family 1 protein [Acidobacteria bacterium]|nr:MAG: glycosyltransferase family 1 protein [Acidobacteriota bacterium]